MHHWIESLWNCQLHRYTRVQLLMHNSIISLAVLTLGLNYSCEEKHLLWQKPPGLWHWISQRQGVSRVNLFFWAFSQSPLLGSMMFDLTSLKVSQICRLAATSMNQKELRFFFRGGSESFSTLPHSNGVNYKKKSLSVCSVFSLNCITIIRITAAVPTITELLSFQF